MTTRLTKRKSSQHKFSSFLDFSQTSCRWIISRKLERNFIVQINQLQPQSEREDESWFMYWLEALDKGKDSLARNHLSAYLEEACYWAAKDSSDRLRLPGQSSTDILLDTFRIAQDNTTDSEQLLKRFKKFDPKRSSLTTYSQRWLKGAIAGAIYREYRVGKYTPWGLLKSVGKTTIRDALEQAGYQEPEVSGYCLLCQCWLEIYATTEPEGGSRTIQEPTPQQIQEIVGLYNQLRLNSSTPREITSGEQLSPTLFDRWMNICIQAVQTYEKSKCIFAYSERFDNGENNEIELSDCEPLGANAFATDSTEDCQIGELGDLVTKKQVYSYLTEEFANLDEQDKKILKLTYGLNCTQKEIAHLLGGEQFQISRTIKRLKRNLLRGVLQRINVELNAGAIDQLNKPLSEWLTEYCQAPICLALETIFSQLPSSDRELLRLYYGGDYDNESLDKTRVAAELTIYTKELDSQIERIKQILQQNLRDYVGKELEAYLESDSKGIISGVDKWLEKDALYASMENNKEL